MVAPHVGMAAAGVRLERQAERGWAVTLLSADPHPCAVVRADGARRAMRTSDHLRVGETLEISGTIEPVRLTLVAALANPASPTHSGTTQAPHEPTPAILAAPGASPVVGGALVDEARRRATAQVVADVPGVRAISDAARAGPGGVVYAIAGLLIVLLLASCAGLWAWFT